jgi:hypothetical protein
MHIMVKAHLMIDLAVDLNRAASNFMEIDRAASNVMEIYRAASNVMEIEAPMPVAACGSLALDTQVLDTRAL